MKKITIIFILLLALSANAVNPVANFVYYNTTPGTASNSGYSTVDASSSHDPDGTISKYKWEFNAGNPVTGYKTFYGQARYDFFWSQDVGANGIFEASIPIKLTVTDDSGATDSVTKTVQVRKSCVSCVTECTNPKNCSQMGWECGSGRESNCRDTINCGGCPSGKVCQNHECVTPCIPYSCSQMGWECGSGTEDKCRKRINCGYCGSGFECINNECEEKCIPNSCREEGWDCSSGYESECESYINCGRCNYNETCIDHECVPKCSPNSCIEEGWECGTGNESECGKYINCGWCGNGKSCINNECVPDCDEKNCSEMNWDCGSGYENCGNYINCGNCERNERCDNHECIPTCEEKTCSEMGWNCGYGFEDGCGNFISCGDCSADEKCENNLCVPDCTPKDCAGMNWDCGYGSESECGEFLSCGNCATNHLCVGNDCICQPETCASLAKECGTQSEPNCGGTLDCGTCPAGETCSNGQCVCAPKTCAEMGWNCDTGNEDRCGELLNCGTCASGELCQNNSCCSPGTCTSLGWECGLDNEPNCGQTINCGACAAGELCINHKCNSPPLVVFKASTLQGLAPLVIDFDGSESSDADNDPLSFKWDFGDGTTSINATETKTYSANGNYLVKLTVSDNHGLEASETKIVRITDKVGITSLTATHPKSKTEKTKIKISCSEDNTSAKIEFLTVDGLPINPPISAGNIEILTNTCGKTPLEIEKTDFPSQGVYQIKATITGQDCDNCPQTRYFVVGRNIDMPAPETNLVVVLLTALAVIFVITTNKKSEIK